MSREQCAIWTIERVGPSGLRSSSRAHCSTDQGSQVETNQKCKVARELALMYAGLIIDRWAEPNEQ
jgi:hypothetical protein